MTKLFSEFDKKSRISARNGIERALEKLQTVGWTQGRSVRYDDADKPISYCIVGALGAVNASSNAEHALTEYLEYKTNGAETCIVSFNDRNDTTKRNVTDLLRGTIKALNKTL